jgi:uncharacterized protein (TIGR03437 family)
VANVKLLSLLVLTVVAGAQTAPNWTEQFPQISPPARIGHAMAYDSAHGQVVLFGGFNGTGNLNDTWLWDGSNWTEAFPKTSPPARNSPAMAYDSVHGQVVLFGGEAGQEQEVVYGDTWVWDGANWTQESPQTSPSERLFGAMAYDSAHGQIVLFGGGEAGPNGNAIILNETWVWDGANWTKESPQTSPPARYSHAMAYDSVHGQVVLFGGLASDYKSTFNDTWLWDGVNWTQAFPQTSPSARSLHAMAYDSAHVEAVLFGGRSQGSQPLGDTWLWDGANWTGESPQASPSAREVLAMAYDSGHDQVALFGGAEITDDLSIPDQVALFGRAAVTAHLSTPLGDTWTWFGGALPLAGPSISGVVSASAFGAFSSVAPGSWVEIYGSNLGPSTQGWTGADFTGNNAPTMLNGVSVNIAGQAAFIDYISPTQVNAQLPSNIATGGPLQLTVTNANGTSTAVNLTVNATEPGLLAPASFKIGPNQYVVAQHSDGSYVLPVGAIAGVASSPAKPGETVVIYGVGFGSVTPNIPAGEIATETNKLTASLQILFENTPAQLPYFGLAPNFVGLYQLNVTVPMVPGSDLVPFTFNLGGVAGTQTLYTAVHQ